MGECGSDDWTATCDHQPPGPQTIRVSATLECPTPGFTLNLTKAEPQGVNEKDLILDLGETAPSGEVPQVITPEEVEYVEESDFEYDTVTIKPDGPEGIKVDHVH